MKGKPFDMRNQAPIFDLSHNWMSEDIRARYRSKYLENQANHVKLAIIMFSLREQCPECLTNHPTNNTACIGTLLVK